MRTRLQALALLAVAAATVALAGCGGGGSGSAAQSAGDFVREVTREFSLGQSGRLWEELHPAEQAFVTKARFVECEKNEGFRLRKFKVLETYSETIDVAGRSFPSTAVSVQVTSDDGITTATVHAVRVGGSWRWVLQPADLAAYRRGACPSG